MKFKQWLEDTTVAGSTIGSNDNDPGDNGLRRVSIRKDDVPNSKIADSLFLGNGRRSRKFFGKGQRSENKQKQKIRFSVFTK